MSLTVSADEPNVLPTMNEATEASTNTNPNPNPTEVHIRVALDDDASRICAVLEALGYRVQRELGEREAGERLGWAVESLTRRCQLTRRERDVLELVLDGLNNDEMARKLGIRRATVKWHMHNLLAKTHTSKREDLLRLALQLGSKSGRALAPD